MPSATAQPKVWQTGFGRSVAGISEAERWLQEVTREAELSGRTAFAMQVCLEEVFCNIVRHGEPGSYGGAEVGVAVAAGGGRVSMTIEDYGSAFDITQAPALRVYKDLDEVEPGGLGIVLIKSFSSAQSYARIGDCNSLTLEFEENGEAAGTQSAETRDPGTEAFLAMRDVFTSRGTHRFEPGEVLMRQGEASGTAYFLLSGAVLVFSETSYGDVPLATLTAPRLVGEIGVLAGLPRTASIRAIEAVTAVPLSTAALSEAGQKNPQILLSVIGQLGRQIGGLNQALSLYTNALAALEQRGFDPGILADLKSPTPELAEFAAAFRRFAEQIRDKRRQQDEMASAALIQESLLPKLSSLEHGGSRPSVHAQIRPARHVGGDFYDFLMLDHDRLAIGIGDVCGKGIPASLFMAIVVIVLRTALREEENLAAAMARANATLCLENASSMFATVFYAILHCGTGQLEYCNCGHLPPSMLPREGDLRVLRGSGVPLALFPELTPQVFTATLEPGDGLVLFTDGVTEANNESGDEYGEERLYSVINGVRQGTVEDIVKSVFASVDMFAGNSGQADDITCLAIKRADHNDPAP